MTSTKDRAKVGKTEWIVTLKASGRYDDPNADIQTRIDKTRRFPTRTAAIRFVTDQLPKQDRATTWDVHADIETGTWFADNFDDPQYGHVLDATFGFDEDVRAYVDIDPSGNVRIDWES